MECKINCQICSYELGKARRFKHHMLCDEHQQIVQDIFPKEKINFQGPIPSIAFLDPDTQLALNQPIVGLFLTTLCFSPATSSSFYLCHVCELKCPIHNIVGHMFSQEHFFNYFVYTNPDDVSFSWKPNLDLKSILWWKLKRESRKTELRHLQALHLPPALLEKLKSLNYTEVMRVFGENEKLIEKFKAMLQKRMTLQHYQSNDSRKHPLLGLQHIVECVCVQPGEKTYYLCTLCSLVLPNHMIIKHVLSFDHIHCYFKARHPSTLMSKESYKDYNSFVHVVLNLAQQAEKINGAGNVSVKQVTLQPDDFKSVNFKSYPQALKSLESITKSILTISVKPESKLEYFPSSANFTETVTLLLRCQNCSYEFNNIFKYMKHMSSNKHITMMQKSTPDAWRGCFGSQQVKFHLGLYTYVSNSLRSNHPPVGTSLVVTCVASDAKATPFYLCFACQESFSQKALVDHFDSRKHLIKTQMYQDPWQLPFGWDGDLDDMALRATAWTSEEEQRGNQITLKIFDIPNSMFLSLNPSDYTQVLYSLQLHHTTLIRKVPKCKKYSKRHQNERFPLLGQQFLVAHEVVVRPNRLMVGCVCLLCKRRLLDEETEAHVFSQEHVTTFLDRFHPGSLDSSAVDTETLLDLAKQAGLSHSVSNRQEIYLEEPIRDPCSYNKVKQILSDAKRRKGSEMLVPKIIPKWKLTSRIPPKDTNKTHQSVAKERCPVTDLKDNGQNTEKQGRDKATLSGETKDAAAKEGSQKICPKDIKKEAETDVLVELKTEEPVPVKAEKIEESCKNTKKNNDAPTELEVSSSIKQETIERRICEQKSEKEKPNTPEKSLNEAKQNEHKLSTNRQQLTSKDDSCVEQLTEIAHICIKVENTETDDGAENQKELTDKALKICIELCCGDREPIYLCGHCLLKIPKKDIRSHVELPDHPKMGRLLVHLGEKMYDQISKQSFQSASLQEFFNNVIKKRERSNQCLNSGSTPTSPTSDQASVTSNSVSAELHNQQQVKEKVVYISEECGTAPDTSETTVATCNTDQGKSSNSENPLTCSPVHRSGKELIKGKNDAGSRLQSTKNKCKADVYPNKTKPLKNETAIETDEPGARLTENTSKISTPQFPRRSISPKSKSVTASKVICNAASSSDTGSEGMHEPEHPPKCAKTESKALTGPKTKKTTTKTTEPEVKSINTEASAKTLTGGNPDALTAAHKRKLPAVPHQITEQIKKPRKDPAHVSPNKKIQSGNLPKIGFSQLILVSCERKQQVYCLLCSVKLNLSSQYHLTSYEHQYSYVKMKYPEWSANELNKQLNHTIMLLAEVERNLPHTRSPQKLEVKKDEYQKLGNLPDNLAIERVKALVKERDLQASSSPTVDSTGHPCHDISSPCDVSSSGIPACHDEMSDTADSNQPEQQASLHQTPEMADLLEDDPGQLFRGSDEEDMQVDVEIHDEPETSMQTDPQQSLAQLTQDEGMADVQAEWFPDAETPLHVEDTPASPSSDSETILKGAEEHCASELQRHLSSNDKDIEEDNLIHERRQSMNYSTASPDPIPGTKAENVAETIQVDQFNALDDNQPRHEVTFLTKGFGVQVEISDKSADRLLTAERQREERDADSQEPQKPVGSAKKVSPVKVCSVELEAVAGRQNQSGLSHKAEPAPKRFKQSEEHSASQANSIPLFGKKAQGSSRLSIYLKASCQDRKQVTGMDSVWECQGMFLKTFFLCEICEKKLSIQDICKHMVSLDHQLKYLRREDPRFLEMFWHRDDLPLEFKMVVLKDVVQELSKREQFCKVDAKCVLLGSELHEFVRTAPISEALKIVKSISDDDKQSVFHLPAFAAHQKSRRHQNGQQNADLQSRRASLPTPGLSAQVLEKTHISKMARQTPEKSHAEEASLVDSLLVVGNGRTSTMDVNSSSTKTDHVVSPHPIVGAQVSYLEPCSRQAQEPESKTAINRLKLNPSPLAVKSSNSKVDPVVPLSSAAGVDPRQEPCSSSLQPHYKSSVSQLKQSSSPLDPNAPYSETNPVVCSGSLNPSQEACSGSPRQTESRPAVSQLRQRPSSLDVNSSNSVTRLVSSCSVNPSRQTCSATPLKPDFTPAVSQLQTSDRVQMSESTSTVGPNLEVSITDELPPARARPAGPLTETLFKTSSSPKDPHPANHSPPPETFENVSPFPSASVPSLVNPVKDKISSIGPRDLKLISNLISVLKQTKYSQSALTNAESKDSSPLSGSKENALVPTADLRDPERLQVNAPQDVCRIARNPEPGISQLPINTIITARSHHIKQICKGKTLTDVSRHKLSFPSAAAPSPAGSVAAPGYAQAVYPPSGHLGSAAAQSPLPLNAVSIYQQYIYPTQSYPHWAADPLSLQSFGYSLTAQTPPGSGNVEMHQCHSMMRRPQSDQ
ncbi:uncharacterized protein LOC105930392 [Fundulus heteroclitus]|uniref:uncharacterized protein LOC105930392 n=1 Tax=Fundulus heteroclitus TaxID=8078 RepID=UPI00165BD1F0|nr:uncharacterized protein LOC105930392 [Fundulus heteroclitus]